MARSINIKFPFEASDSGGVFATNTTTDKAYRDNLLALLTLKKGQRPMRNDMYSPIYDYLHEQIDEISMKRLEEEIVHKVRDYIPQVEIKKIKFTPRPDDNLLGIKIIFTVTDFFNVEQSIEINMPTDETDRLNNY
jgi:phage baseplate assembly protein W